MNAPNILDDLAIRSLSRETAPEPLPALPPVLPFDMDYLPSGLRPFVEDITERMQCPPDYAAVTVIAMMGAVIGTKVGIRPKLRDNWLVIPNIWAAIVGKSGFMKSPTMSACLAPLKALQALEFERFAQASKDAEDLAEIAKLETQVMKSKARKLIKEGKSRQDAAKAFEGSGDDAVPPPRRWLTNNASYEALGELLVENPGGILVESDELIGLLKQLDASGQEVARSFYLTGYDGTSSYTFDRILRGKGINIPAVCISIVGGIQPGVLAGYVRQAVSGGAGADGLLQRFGLLVYPDVDPHWEDIDRYPNRTARNTVSELVGKFAHLDPSEIGAESDDFCTTPFLRFTPEAQELFTEWRTALEGRLRAGDEHPAIESHLSKYRKLVPALALINHLCEGGYGPVTAESLERALALSEYLESHARRVYSSATNPAMEAARAILNRLEKGSLSAPFTARDLQRKGWAGLDTSDAVQGAITLLVEYGHIVGHDEETGGRPSTVYEWRRI